MHHPIEIEAGHDRDVAKPCFDKFDSAIGQQHPEAVSLIGRTTADDAHAIRHDLMIPSTTSKDRIDEARLNSWLGEVQGLQVSLNAATNSDGHIKGPTVWAHIGHR